MSLPPVDLVQLVTKSTASFPRPALPTLRRFCIDVALVALGLRTAYLLDHFSIPETTARQFAGKLRERDIIFQDVRLVFHAKMEQTFIVNISLLHDRLVEAYSRTPWTSFIYLTPEPKKAVSAPPEIFTACQTLLDASAESTTSCDTSISSLNIAQMIGLAGFLLEYPVSYIPSVRDQDTFLHGVLLDVFECFLIPSSNDPVPYDPKHSMTNRIANPDAWLGCRYSFMKFSRPAAYSESQQINSTALSEKIKHRFNNRLGTSSGWRAVKVNHETRTLDRVAL